MSLNSNNSNDLAIFYITNKNIETELIFVNKFKKNKKEDKSEQEINFNSDGSCIFKQGKLIFNFLTADFSTEALADKTFFNKFKNLKDEIKNFTTDIEMIDFQKKFRDCVDFTFYYDVFGKGYDVKFKEYMRHADYHKSLQYLKNDIDVLLDTPVIDTKKERTNEDILKMTLYTNDIYVAYSLPALLYIDLKKYVEFGNLPIRKCKNCDKYFTAQGRKDELYCTRLYKNTNKTCKQIGSALIYSERLENDAALALYRNMTKKKLMQISRNKENTKLADKYANWKKEAKQEYEKYKHGNLTDEEFIKWLELNDYQISE